MRETSWWEAYNDGVRELQESGWAENLSALSPDVCALLEDVDAECARAGSRGASGASTLRQGKYRIVIDRAQAWAAVLLRRGWARPGEPARWAARSFHEGGEENVLVPAAKGAVPLVLTIHAPATADRVPAVCIAAGDPAVILTSIPDCFCEDCDPGPAALLEEIDQWVLSVVDGSLDLAVTAKRYSVRTSFGSEGRSPVQFCTESTAFVAAPWPPGWSARSLVPDFAGKKQQAWSAPAAIERLRMFWNLGPSALPRPFWWPRRDEGLSATYRRRG
ncbi:DUF6226 family protein [Lolliginicoccus suaedae]|uniref:DUF6226 family protein n=1 Tax=Lolliginicoccus suaedae TaxID=2605429 RepID=UPI0016597655|nr:DUF6226 family protein [Lolliginicoccus suaedae]